MVIPRIYLGLVLLCLAAPAFAQDRPGIAVDAKGGAVIDPTKNVLDLVEAAIRRQDDLRTAEAKFQNAMRDAETRRLNELNAQKQVFDLELARVLRAGLDASTLLLATQLKEVKTDLADRTSHLEQFRWESGGRQTYQDPAALQLQKQVELLTQISLQRAGQDKGMGDLIGYIMAGITVLILLISAGVGVIGLFMRRESQRVTEAIERNNGNGATRK